MRQSRYLFVLFITAIFLLCSFTFIPGIIDGSKIVAQVPAVDTPTAQPTPVTPVPTLPPETVTPPATVTPPPTIPPVTPPPTITPAPPVPIPEPITVVLFGTGLAALSAAAASRRKKDGAD